MSPEPISAVAGRVPAATAKAGFRLHPSYIAPLFITLVLLIAGFTVQILESPWKTAAAIGASIVTELILGRIFFGKWPNVASAYVSGISVGILLRSPHLWPYVYCAVLSISSKYVLRWHGRHLWNPSNFGIAASLVTLHNFGISTLTIQFGNSIGAMLVIWTLGSIIVGRLKRFHQCATYVVSFFAFAAVRALIQGTSYWAQVAPITGPMYQLFTFFMITDPKTTVRGKKGQMLVVFLVALLEAILRLNNNTHAPYYALFFVGPIANALEIWSDRRKATRLAASPAPAG